MTWVNRVRSSTESATSPRVSGCDYGRDNAKPEGFSRNLDLALFFTSYVSNDNDI